VQAASITYPKSGDREDRMKTQHRAIIAIAISVVFFFVYYTYISPPKKAPPEQSAPVEQATEVAKAEASTDAAAAAAATPEEEVFQTDVPIKTVTLQNDVLEMDITSDGGTATAWRLKDFNETTEKTSPNIDLTVNSTEIPGAMSLSFEDSSVKLPSKLRYEVVSSTDHEAMLSWKGEGLEIQKTIKLENGSYVADVSVEIKNGSKGVFSAKPALMWSRINEKQKSSGFFGFLKRSQIDIKKAVFYINGDVDRGDDEKGELVTLPGAVNWSGIESRYFISAIIPRIQGEGLAAQYGTKPLTVDGAGGSGVWAGVVEPKIMIAPGETGQAAFSVYSGPKEINRLKALGVGLEKAIDYGWFTVIAVPILYVLKFFYGIVHNYGVAIILLTILIKLLLHPINVKSLKSMKAMQQLQPRLKELQQKHKGDKQKINQETMQLFRAHKVNPMGGCLPMILQLPIYIALYKVLWNSIELFHAPFFWFYRDLSAPDPYMISPILLGVFMLLQQKLMPSASGDPTQKKMMMLMPIMFTVFMIFLPVGLVIYILVNTAMSVTQQYMYNKGIGIMDIIRGKAKFRTTAKAL
jgi:YidC/Oxa1 family membrane protein insertase